MTTGRTHALRPPFLANLRLAGAGLRAIRPWYRPLRTVRTLVHGIRAHGPTLRCAVSVAAARHGGRIAIVDDASVDHRGLERLVDERAAEVAGLLGEGGTVAVAARGLDQLAWMTGALGAGARTIAVNPDIGEDDLDVVLARHRVDLLVTDDGPRVVRARTDPRPGDRPRRGLVMLTSGTTGTPRALGVATRAGHLLTGTCLIGATGIRGGEPVLVLPPLFHGYGLAVTVLGLLAGAPVHLPRAVPGWGRTGLEKHGARPHPSTERRAGELMAYLERESIAVLVAVPAHVATLLGADGRPPSLRALLTGGDRLSPGDAAEVGHRFGPVLTNLYGSLEAGTATVSTGRDPSRDPASVGRPLWGVRIEIVDEEGSPVPRGVSGRVRILSPLAATGDPASRGRRVVTTGDRGRLVAGRLRVEGRLDALVASGGEAVHPDRVRDVLHQDPAVLRATVHAVSDPVYGHRLVATVTPSPGALPQEGALRDRVRRRLGPHAVPRSITVTPS